MARYWFREWRDPRELASRSLNIGLLVMALAVVVRLLRGYGNIFPHGDNWTWSFFYDQKYPPSMFFQLWWTGISIFLVGAFAWFGQRTAFFNRIGLATVGKVSLFYYGMHIALLAIFTKRLGFFYREYEVIGSWVGWAGLIIVMFPLCIWYARVKRRSRNWLVRMI